METDARVEGGASVPPSSIPDDDEYPTHYDPDDPSRRHRFMYKVWAYTGKEWECHYCHKELDPDAAFGDQKQVTIDHIVPQKIGKYQGLWNLVLCCTRCGKLKGAMPYEMFTGEERLPKQCHAHFYTTAEALFASRFRDTARTLQQGPKHISTMRSWRNGIAY